MVISIAGYFEVANFDLSQLDCAATLSLEDEGRPRADLCCTLRDDLFYFPSIDWLGGPHDGFRHATSLSAYVWLRLSIVKFPKERAALWQSALSLGLLEIVTGMKISEDLIISRRPDGKHVLTSRSVSAVVSHWLSRTTPIHYAAIVSQRRNHAQSMLKWAREAIREARPGEEGAIFADAELDATNVEDILATLTLLTRQLMIIFPCDFEIGSQEHSHFAEEFCSLLEPGNVASRKHMKEKGWCPAIVTSVDPEVIPYASQVVPFSRSPTEHASCSEQNCTTQNLDTAAYTTQHAPTCSDSSCSFLLPSFADVKNLLSLEEIPVIVYDGGTQLMVHSATAGPYVAISHVWADGLGSTTEKGLPTCQISRMTTFARQRNPKGAFWVDALCVPEEKSLRKKVINLMAKTYECAEAVIVFDAGIRSLCTSTTPVREIIVRILTSGWMHRLWTLQEALLARELLFEFADGLFWIKLLEYAHAESQKQTLSPIGFIPQDPTMSQSYMSHTLQLLFKRRRLCPWTLMNLVPLITSRSTSKPEDETIAVASLLGIRGEGFARISGEPDAESRMKTFLLELKIIPAMIIFITLHSDSRTGPKRLQGSHRYRGKDS